MFFSSGEFSKISQDACGRQTERVAPILQPSLCPYPLQWDPLAPPTERWSLFPQLLNLGRLGDLLWTKEGGRSDSVPVLSPSL